MQALKPTNNSVFRQNIHDLEKIVDFIPGAVIVHELENLTVQYMSPWGLKKLGITAEDVVYLSQKEYFQKFFNPVDAREYAPKLQELLKKGELNEVVTYFQQVRTINKPGWSWYLSSTKIFMKDENGTPTHVITVSTPVEPIHHIDLKVNRLLEEKNFIIKNHELYAGLTKREKEILRYMALGKNTHDISETLFISEMTVETHRKNIRKKICAHTHYDIILFAQSFDMI
jgi:DNA-binding CsgD family transcriptional regulator